MYLTRQEIVEIYGEKTAKTLTTVHCTPAPGATREQVLAELKRVVIGKEKVPTVRAQT